MMRDLAISYGNSRQASIQQYIENYCLRNGIKPAEPMFPITERAIQK